MTLWRLIANQVLTPLLLSMLHPSKAYGQNWREVWTLGPELPELQLDGHLWILEEVEKMLSKPKQLHMSLNGTAFWNLWFKSENIWETSEQHHKWWCLTDALLCRHFSSSCSSNLPLIFLPWTELLFMLQPRRSMLIRGQLGVCPHIWNWSGWPKQNEAEEKSAKWTLKAVIEEVPV